jgi:hypothetical protein
MASLRSHEGYLIIDHRNSPGIEDALAVPHGLPLGAGQGLFEAATYTCKHCQRVDVVDRNRERVYCRGCDHFICVPCGIERARTGECRTFEQVIDRILASAT